ncbi:MAG: lysozyme [Rubrivivax sp.]|nr:MAG: lysozyme [Rubrivivax sp.]
MTEPKSPASRRNALIAAAAALAIPAEGMRQLAYRDPPNVLTVCYGHTGGVDPTRQYSVAECRTLLDADMAQAVDAVLRCAPGVPDSVAVAFSDAVYNLGPTVACDRTNSTAARLLATKQWRQACEQLPRWDKARVGGQLVALPGLTKRRAVEREVCMAGLS